MKLLRAVPFLSFLAVALAMAGPHAQAAQAMRPARVSADTPFWAGKPDGAAFAQQQQQRLAVARQAIDRMVAVRGPRTIENTLRPYDEAHLFLDAAGFQSDLLQEVHPDSALRAAAEKASQEVAAFRTELSLNRGVYDALATLDVSKADPETRYYVQKTLRDFRLAGVDRDEVTRQQIQALNDELVRVGQEFGRNIRTDVRQVTVSDPAELDGLPADWIARHKPGADGRIVVTTDYPDAVPVLSYAKSDDLRKRLYMANGNRAYPANLAVLDSMLAKRYRLARLHGFTSWADYITADKMVGSARNAADFIDRVAAASGARADREYETLLARKRKEVPDASVVNAWEQGYWTEQLRKSDYAFDSQSVRPYFPYDRVRDGVLAVTSRLFGVEFRRMSEVPVWDPSVECYEMLEQGRLAGRLYLDMHPRENKYKHAATFELRTGLAGRQIPEAALVCNFPGGQPNDPGLMQFSDVSTFFHEFGHLLHFMFAGKHRWIGIGGDRTEWDFVEVPSQMLQEWARDPVVLATFAKHYQTNEPIPASLVAQMNRANDFGKGLYARRQMVLAAGSLGCHDRPAAEVNTTELFKSLTAKYLRSPFVEGTHAQCAFSHLDGYSAIYYTYMWSLVIEKDLFARFDAKNLLAPGVARRYRDTILAPGGSAPATQLVQNFLGRPFHFDAWQAWLDRDE